MKRLNASDMRIEDLFCSECGELIVNVHDYACCPNGHGRLKPKRTLLQKHLRSRVTAKHYRSRLLLKVPSGSLVHRKGQRLYLIAGDQKTYKQIRPYKIFGPQLDRTAGQRIIKVSSRTGQAKLIVVEPVQVRNLKTNRSAP